MTYSTTQGARFYLGSTSMLTTFEASSYTQVKGVVDLGSWGVEAQEVAYYSVESTVVRRRAGIKDYGAMTIIVARDPTDSGQTQLRNIVGGNVRNFKVKLDDEEAEVPQGTTYYFNGVVLSVKTNFGGADDITTTEFVIGIDGAVLETIE